MATASSNDDPAAPGAEAAPRFDREVNVGDIVFRAVTAFAGVLVILALALVVVDLGAASGRTLVRDGASFLGARAWDPVHGLFGALPFLYGSVVTSIAAVVGAVPIAFGIAVYLTEYAPLWLRGPLGFLVELLAAVPSVVYGFWGVLVLVPWLRTTGEPALASALGFLPIFQGPPVGNGMLAAVLIIGLMVLPTISSVSREVLSAVPLALREGAQALGATRSEMLRAVVFPYARSGLAGAVLLGTGRALGETMAVTMVIGNRPTIAASAFAPASTMATVIANQYDEASGAHLEALATLGLLLLALTVALNVAARLLAVRTRTAGSALPPRAPRASLLP